MKTISKPQFNGKSLSNVLYTKFNISEIQIDTSSSIRHEYDQEQLEELAESIRQNNNELLQPILITRIYANSDKDIKFLNESKIAYNVVAGRRRFIACRDILKLEKISAIVKEFDSFESEFKAQFAENEERVNWSDINYVKAISFLKERNPDITQIEIANIFGKNLNWIKKKQQHLSMIQEIPESSSPNLSTSILSELQSLPAHHKKDMINSLNNLSKQGIPLPNVKSIRTKVKEIKETGKLLEKIMPISSVEIPTKLKNKIDKKNKQESIAQSIEMGIIYKAWKNSGKILNEDKDYLSDYLQLEIFDHKRKIKSAKESIQKLEPSLKELVSDSITLQEMPLFPTKSKAGKK